MYVTVLPLIVIAPLVLQVLARPAPCGIEPKPSNGKAIYVITNDKVNSVVSLPVGHNGLLSAGTVTGTGGAGGVSLESATNQPAAQDALNSQSSLTIAGDKLFAVNAGSNTLSMFTIDQQDPTKLTMVGQPVPVPGEFPVTVAASSWHKLACVGSTGAKAGVSCSSFSAQGLEPMDSLRVFDLGQTTPPAGPLNTVSQIFFSENESTLFTTVKGDPTKNNTGFLAAFPVTASWCNETASVSQEAIESSPSGTTVLFGSQNIPGSSNIFVTDASFGAVVLSVDGKDIATTEGKGVIPNQTATCWVAISPATNTAFVTDPGRNRLVEMSLQDASVECEIDLSANGDPGLIDLRAAGDFVYALAPGNGTTQAAITVVNVLTKTQVQHLQLQSMGVDNHAQGMALLV